MQLLKTEGPFMDLITGFFLSGVGLYIVLHRRKLVDALMSSSKVFWNKIGIAHSENTGLSNIMIPLLGGMFSIIGFCLVVRAVAVLLTKRP